MKKLFCISLTALSILSIGCQSNLTSIPEYPGLKLVFADEFDGREINASNWTCEVGDQWFNQELQAYTARRENAYVRDGSLVIVAQKESYHGKEFTSARIISRYKQDFLYGRFEARIKLPTGRGMWPAFWMMPTDDAYGEWAASGEIDILEAKNVPMEIRGNLHFGGNHPDNASAGSNAYSDGSDFSQAYHVFALEWEPKEIRWYCDGHLYKTVKNWWTGSKKDNGTFPAPFDRRFHILLNLAVGGSYVRCTEPSCITATFPQKMYIDYVRVYQKNN